MAAAAAPLNIEKPEQPQLAKHDSTILGRILLNNFLYKTRIY